MSKQHRKVTVDNSKSVRDSSQGSRRRQSVFDRLGPGGGRERLSSERPETCRNWLRDRRCPYGNQCLFQHSLTSSRDKRARGERSPDSRRDKLHVEDLRYKQEKSRHRSSHKDKDAGESSKGRSRDLSPHMLIRRNRTPDSDTPPPDWDNPVELPETDDWEGNESLLDFERELTLEMRRQQLQRELELEIEKEKREKENENVVIEKQIMSDESPPTRRKRLPYSQSPSPSSTMRKNRDKRKELSPPDFSRGSKGLLRTPPKEPSYNKKGGTTSHFMDSPPPKSRYKSPILRKGPHTPSPPHPEESVHVKKKKKKVPGLKNKETSKKNKAKNLPMMEHQEIHHKKKYRSLTPPPPPKPKVKRKVRSPSPSTSANSQRSYSPRQRSLSPRRRSPIAHKKKSPLLKKYSVEKHISPKRVERERKLSPFPEKVKKKTSRPNSRDSRKRVESHDFEKRYREDKVVERKVEKSREEALIRKERESRRDEWERKQDETTALRLERQHEREMELSRRKLRVERMREERISPLGGRRSHRESPASLSTSSLEGDHREPKLASKIIPTPPIKRRRYPPEHLRDDLRDGRYPPEHLRDELREGRYPPRKFFDGDRGFKGKILERPAFRGYVPGGNDRGRGRGKIRPPPFGKFEPERDIKHSLHFKGRQSFKRKHSDLEDLSGGDSPYRKRRRSGERERERRGSPQITSEVPRIARLGRVSKENSPAIRRREEKEERPREKEKPSESVVEERLPAEEVFSDWSNASEDSLIEASSAKSRSNSNSTEQEVVTDNKQAEDSKLKVETEKLSSRNSSRTNSRERLNREHDREKDSVMDKDQDKDRETKKIFESFIEQERILRGRSPSIGSTSSRHSSVGSEYKRWEGRTHRDSDRSDKKEDVGRGRESDREGDKEPIKSKLEESERSEEKEVMSHTSESDVKDKPLKGDNVGLEKREIESESVLNKSPGEVAELLIENDYEEISDGEFDAMIEDDSNRDEKSEEQPNQIETVDVLDVDFASLMMNSEVQSQEPGTALKRFTPGNVLATIGVSKALAGPQLMTEIHEVCQKSFSDDHLGSKLKLFESDLGAFNATSMKRQRQRTRLFTDIGPCRRALCARRDMAIRKQLRKSDKDSDHSGYTAPDIDLDLYRICIQLFKRKNPMKVKKTVLLTSPAPVIASF